MGNFSEDIHYKYSEFNLFFQIPIKTSSTCFPTNLPLQQCSGNPDVAQFEAWVSAGSEQESLVLFSVGLHLPYSAVHVLFLFTDFL